MRKIGEMKHEGWDLIEHDQTAGGAHATFGITIGDTVGVRRLRVLSDGSTL